MLPLKQNDCVIYASRIICALDSILLSYQTHSWFRFLSISLTAIIITELVLFTFLKADILQDPRLSAICIGLNVSICIGESFLVMLFMWLIIGWAVKNSPIFHNANVWIAFVSTVFPYVFFVIKYTHDKIKEVKANPLSKQGPGVEDDVETIAEEAEEYEIS